VKTDASKGGDSLDGKRERRERVTFDLEGVRKRRSLAFGEGRGEARAGAVSRPLERKGKERDSLARGGRRAAPSTQGGSSPGISGEKGPRLRIWLDRL